MTFVRRCGLVGRVPAFEPGTRVRFPAGSEILIYWDWVCPLCSVLIVSGGGPDIVLTTNSRNPALPQGGREISAIIVIDDYLWYKEPKSPYNFFLILIFNELLKFKTSDEWQH